MIPEAPPSYAQRQKTQPIKSTAGKRKGGALFLDLPNISIAWSAFDTFPKFTI